MVAGEVRLLAQSLGGDRIRPRSPPPHLLGGEELEMKSLLRELVEFAIQTRQSICIVCDELIETPGEVVAQICQKHGIEFLHRACLPEEQRRLVEDALARAKAGLN